MSSNKHSRPTQFFKQELEKAGFNEFGVSKAAFLEEEAPLLEKWLNQKRQGKMSYLENYFEKRLDPRLLMPGAQSVISVTYNYFPDQEIHSSNRYKIAKYAFGEDYHFVIKRKLKLAVENLRKKLGEFQARVFVDSAPVMERQWARKSGLGWIGKNSLLIHPKKGSYYFLAEIITDLELESTTSMKDYCGTCTKCMDACPTDAIPEPYLVDGSKCISYFTIELKEEIPEEFRSKYDNWIFGCDICQDVCPWNRFSRPHQEPDFEPSDEFKALSDRDWENLTESTFNKVFKKSAIKRAKLKGLKRNIKFLDKKNPV